MLDVCFSLTQNIEAIVSNFWAKFFYAKTIGAKIRDFLIKLENSNIIHSPIIRYSVTLKQNNMCIVTKKIRGILKYI